MTTELTPRPIRKLSVDDLGLTVPNEALQESAVSLEDLPPLEADNEILLTVKRLLQTYGGVMFVGPPGTGKSWWAARVAQALTDGDLNRMRFIQFHPSYQYEDFMMGYLPTEDGGFVMTPRHFVGMCEDAADNPDDQFVLIIDELSRGDPARVFGEALTYIERTKRGLSFRLASGSLCAVPPNLHILATINPLDRGVDEVDAALHRRFGKIAMDPDVDALREILEGQGMASDLVESVCSFFREVQVISTSNPYAALGHAYFIGVSSRADLELLWDHQLRFHFERAFRLDIERLQSIRSVWEESIEPTNGGNASLGNQASNDLGTESPASADNSD